MNPNAFQSSQTQEIIKYVSEAYGNELEFLWSNSPKSAIWRNPHNRKWYALLMSIPKSKLGFNSAEEVEILDVRFDKNEALDFARSHDHIYPGYHMSKTNWITVILDGSLETATITSLINQPAWSRTTRHS